MDVVLLTCVERPDRKYSDLTRACILAHSLERNLDPADSWTIHVVAADAEIEEVRDRLSHFSLDYRFHPHSSFLAQASDADGWRLQQFLKLLISRKIEEPFYLSIDSDQILTRRLRISDLVRDGRALMTPEPRAVHEAWWVGSANILGTTLVNDPASVMSCVCMATSVVRRVLARLLERLGDHWMEALLAREDWIEYSLYFTLAQAGYEASPYHFITRPALLGAAQSVWYPSDLEEWDVTQAFHGDHYFICVQSSLDLPPDMVWDLTAKYLGPCPDGLML